MGTTPHTPAPAVVETEGIGNRAANLKQVKFSSDHALPTLLGVRWDSDKIRGIRLEMNDGTHAQAGGYDDSGYPLNQYHFKSGEKLSRAWLRDSGYGYGSVCQMRFVTSTGGTFSAGVWGFDNEISLAVGGACLAGFHAWVNPDNFINGLAFLVRRDAPTIAATAPISVHTQR